MRRIPALAAVFLLVLTPHVLRGQQAATDAWRESFSARLDESLAQLRAEAATAKQPALVVTRGENRSDSIELPLEDPSGMSKGGSQAAMISRILWDSGLPPALTSVVQVESAFNPLALSPRCARGLWQLMPSTARRYGLKVEPHADDRVDPVKSTRAAAAYIKDLLAQFRDWPLALAAYNAGEDRVARAMARTGARDFWTLRRRAALPEETLNYVPAVLARIERPLPAAETQFSVFPADTHKTAPPASRIAYATPAAE